MFSVSYRAVVSPKFLPSASFFRTIDTSATNRQQTAANAKPKHEIGQLKMPDYDLEPEPYVGAGWTMSRRNIAYRLHYNLYDCVFT